MIKQDIIEKDGIKYCPQCGEVIETFTVTCKGFGEYYPLTGYVGEFIVEEILEYECRACGTELNYD